MRQMSCDPRAVRTARTCDAFKLVSKSSIGGSGSANDGCSGGSCSANMLRQNNNVQDQEHDLLQGRAQHTLHFTIQTDNAQVDNIAREAHIPSTKTPQGTDKAPVRDVVIQRIDAYSVPRGKDITDLQVTVRAVFVCL